MDEKEYKEQNIEFSMVFRYRMENKNSLQESVAVAYFFKYTANYKIYGAGYLANWSWREVKNDFRKPISYQNEVSKRNCVYIGNSNNKELLEVKVWEYVKKNHKK